MSTYASKEWILWRLDSLLEYHRRGSISTGALLNAGLKELFDGDQAPWMYFHSVETLPSGQLLITASGDGVDPDDMEEWAAAMQTFVEGRFQVEPRKWEHVEKTVDEVLRDLALAFAGPHGWVGTKAVTKKPKAKPLGKPVPPHVALYQQRGSKGKRKAW